MSRSAKPGAPKLAVQRFSDPGAEYLRLTGIIDKSFGIELLGAMTKPTALDLKEVTSITSQGVERWCDLIRQLPSTTPLYLVNVPDCLSTQIQYVPNFLGHAELVTLQTVAKCTGCERAVPSVYDLINFNAGSLLLDKCSKCGAGMVAVDVDPQQLAKRRARSLPDELAALLARIGIYKRRTVVAQKPFEVQRLMEGRTNLLRLAGTFDEKFRWLRMLDGLEGTLIIDARELEVTPPQFKKLGDVLHQMVKVASQVLLVDVPVPALEAIVAQRAALAPLIIHSVLAPCYCATCDEIRPIAVEQSVLLSSEPQAVCPRCGREAALVAGTIAIESLHEMLRPTPTVLLPVVERLDEVFSSAEVEHKLTGSGTPAPTDPTTAPERIGPYRIVRTIAAGGMATVFLAVRDDFSKPMALKLLRREVLAQARISLTMFLREARLSARLNHPNIIQVFDVDESEGNLYIVMEYLEGHALWRILGQYARPFPPRIALRIIGQVLRALHHAHTARDADGKPLSIVHRDVSPSNILIGVDGNVKLIDFGIALAGSTPDVLAGNPAWMSPEQFSGGALDGRSDLFSVATVLHELLVGKQLFTGSNVGEIGGQVISAVLPTPPGIPASLARVLDKAHQREPEQRYQTAAEFADALRAVASDIGVGGEASEHEVRDFVTNALATPRRTPTSHDLALCETPVSEPHQLVPKRRTSKKIPVQRPTPNERPAVPASLADTPEAGPQLTPPTGTAAPPRRDHGFDSPPSTSRGNAAALLPLVDPKPNRMPTLLIVALVAGSLGLIALLSVWMLAP